MDAAWEALILNKIKSVHDEQRRLEQDLNDLVLEAHRGSIPWERIGKKLGVTRQAAHRKYSKLEKERENQPHG